MSDSSIPEKIPLWCVLNRVILCTPHPTPKGKRNILNRLVPTECNVNNLKMVTLLCGMQIRVTFGLQ